MRRFKPYRPLRDQAVFARVALGEGGHSVIWPVEQLDMGADTLWQYAGGDIESSGAMGVRMGCKGSRVLNPGPPAILGFLAVILVTSGFTFPSVTSSRGPFYALRVLGCHI